MANQRPQTLAEAMEITCLSEEVFDEQYGPLQKKEKNMDKNNNGGNKGATNQFQQAQKGAQNNIGKRKKKANQQVKREKLICPTCNKKHDECWESNPKCFACGEQCHFNRNYPKDKEEKGVPAKLNVMNAGDTAHSILFRL